ncbi:hypothetical protein Ocin01_14802 [Orchesella cincta]|uniref:Protein sleepless n=1 Tax=Orchesella cincta TaxID=48709 RepID=A0A1D2MFX9_ORCCI|nr:hypothetical protein Ocin01_14802 [Orchesella cincta]
MKTVLLILVSFTSFLAITQGLECYNCYYQDSSLPIGFNPKLTEHPSCQRGSVPDESLKVDCSEVHFGSSEGENVTYTSSKKGDGTAFKEECLDGKLGKVTLQSTVPEITTILEQEAEMFNSFFTDTHVCNCNDELCNRDP